MMMMTTTMMMIMIMTMMIMIMIMLWYDKWYDMIWCYMIWYDMIWYDMIWYDMIWYDMTRRKENNYNNNTYALCNYDLYLSLCFYFTGSKIVPSVKNRIRGNKECYYKDAYINKSWSPRNDPHACYEGYWQPRTTSGGCVLLVIR